MAGSPPGPLAPRDSTTDEFLNLISDPFSGQLQQDALVVSMATSLGITLTIALIFCFIRPFNSVVYAPRLKHADEKHAPPAIGKGLLAWTNPVLKTEEDHLAEIIGLDATVFLRFTKMCRNIFLVLTVVGCGIIIPMNVVGGNSFTKNYTNIKTFAKMTPQYLFGEVFWGFVACAYIFDVVVCFFLWRNYKAIARLRKNYFDSYDYQNSLHSRTLMITDIPKSLRSDEGVVKIADGIKTTPSLPRCTIGRNVKDLPDLIEDHEEMVRKLEIVLAKYLKNPDKLGPRPMCKPSKKDKSAGTGKVDAIDYLTSRIKKLETEIRETRETVDKRNAMPYGFASYKTIDEAHGVAALANGKHPEGTTVHLAPKPNDLIWKNLSMTPQQRKWQRIYNNLWIVLLTLVWVVPNALIAVFLTNLSNLGKIWKDFQTEMNKDPKTWAAVQGILSPAITSLVYYYLPIIFRKLSMKAGDITKTSRERHVVAKLYSFFVFNNLVVFSLFSAVWQFVAAVIKARETDTDLWNAMKSAHFVSDKLFPALCNVSPFWVTWLLQRNLGAVIDLAQLVNLAWGSFTRKFSSPTPREMIEHTAPPRFEYASYYNYFLYYSTISLCFGVLQPIVLPVCAFYFTLDYYLKKYLLMYVFATKTESGGQFWRVLFNRFIFAMFLSNVIVALMIAAKAQGLRVNMLIAMIPLPFLLAGFKWYCARQYDTAMRYYNKGVFQNPESQALPDKQARHGDSVGVRYGHPALYKPLMTPMVHAKAKDVLTRIYNGRLNTDDTTGVAGYSDTYSMKPMTRSKVGKPFQSTAPFELVTEGQLDFENFKNRPEWREEFGGEGEMYGKPVDLVRPGTPGSFVPGQRGRSESRDSERTYAATPDHDGDGTVYPSGYHMATPNTRSFSPDRHAFGGSGVAPQSSHGPDNHEQNLLRGAAPMGSNSRPGTPQGRGENSYEFYRTGRQ